ncbi:hypothetical protein OPU38_11415, partial [Acinetobacter baumannii]|nr:hypothetical protein [Acinetobacter baumannii]
LCCRCETCVEWALSTGLIKSKPKPVVKRGPDARQLRIWAQKNQLTPYATAFNEDWDLLALEVDYSVTAFQLERIYQGRSEIDHNFVWNRVKRVADRLVAEKLRAKGGGCK